MQPYLFFKGECEDAFKLYATCLGGKIEAMLSYEGTPAADHVPAELRSKIINARLAVGNTVLLGTDVSPDRYHEPQGFSVALPVDSPTEAERVFQALAEGGTVRIPLEQNFFAVRYGTLVDRFGIPWMIVCQQPA
ncbi:VOC family protein [Mesorhizobium sophorae]|uniref:VOC family protein n=1 Tax=Mesorhizobium sophorae TaxID=1300294 RepID=UPI000BA395B1|nr:glyoxalase/bleomycin resistance/extradiol dioxygenase family protein [Mesorhizobium sophorae]